MKHTLFRRVAVMILAVTMIISGSTNAFAARTIDEGSASSSGEIRYNGNLPKKVILQPRYDNTVHVGSPAIFLNTGDTAYSVSNFNATIRSPYTFGTSGSNALDLTLKIGDNSDHFHNGYLSSNLGVTVQPGKTVAMDITGTLYSIEADVSTEQALIDVAYTVTSTDSATYNGQFTVYLNNPITLSVTGNEGGTIGSQMRISAVISGGTAPYTYTWTNLENNQQIGESATISFVPTAASTRAKLRIRDTNGVEKETSFTITASNNGSGGGSSSLPDSDGDGVPDAYDNHPNTPGNPDDELNRTVDTDGDGIPDYVDKHPTTPGDPETEFDRTKDTDGDGVPDYIDKHPYTPGNPADEMDLTKDTDGDGVPDYIDKHPFTPGNYNDEIDKTRDSDGDGIPDYMDPTPFGDGTSRSNSTVDITKDTDGDGVPDYVDRNPNQANPHSVDFDRTKDSDGDKIPDYVDKNPHTPGSYTVDFDRTRDTDRDGVPDYVDPDPFDASIKTPDLTRDTDGDGIPDFMDDNPYDPNIHTFDPTRDTDGDGIPDYIDENPYDASNRNINKTKDTDGDGIPDYLDPEPYGASNGRITPYSEVTRNGNANTSTNNSSSSSKSSKSDSKSDRETRKRNGSWNPIGGFNGSNTTAAKNAGDTSRANLSGARTGDETPIGLYIVMMILGLGGLIVAYILYRKYHFIRAD